MCLDRLRHAAETRQRETARLVSGHALTLEFLRGLGEVRVDLCSEIAIAP